MIAVDTNILARFYCDDPNDSQARRQRPIARRLMLESTAVFVPLTLPDRKKHAENEKSEWEERIRLFSLLDYRSAVGNRRDRQQTYRARQFFTICNYEQVLRAQAADARNDSPYGLRYRSTSRGESATRRHAGDDHRSAPDSTRC